MASRNENDQRAIFRLQGALKSVPWGHGTPALFCGVRSPRNICNNNSEECRCFPMYRTGLDSPILDDERNLYPYLLLVCVETFREKSDDPLRFAVLQFLKVEFLKSSVDEHARPSFGAAFLYLEADHGICANDLEFLSFGCLSIDRCTVVGVGHGEDEGGAAFRAPEVTEGLGVEECVDFLSGERANHQKIVPYFISRSCMMVRATRWGWGIRQIVLFLVISLPPVSNQRSP